MARTVPTSARAAAPSSSSSPHSSTNSNADLVFLSSSDDDDDRAATTTRKMRRGPIYQKWLFSDEVELLTWLAAERRRSGAVPSASKLFKAITKKDGQDPALMEPERDDPPPPPPALNRANLTADDLKKKVSNLKTKFSKAVKSGGPGDEDRDKTLYGLSREIWLARA
ncbi:uncharacterized protein C2845_PM16G01590 [Panicum miliaceum]|uniref:Uncharacterized protein n=1 Tax=Panicum miliaceum TaxID=4540 RepID=A0A3L6PVQ4_PANMI|nr:uncharacterized protein C2845_PM16G01590 [Panicum miliaceum]